MNRISIPIIVLICIVTLAAYAVSDSTKNPVKGKETILNQKSVTENAIIKVTFIELGSVNCVPCRMMQPVMAEVEKKYKDQVDVIFYDVWTPLGRPFGERYGVRSIPTQVFLDKDGKEYYRHVGFFPLDNLEAILKLKGVK